MNATGDRCVSRSLHAKKDECRPFNWRNSRDERIENVANKTKHAERQT